MQIYELKVDGFGHVWPSEPQNIGAAGSHMSTVLRVRLPESESGADYYRMIFTKPGGEKIASDKIIPDGEYIQYALPRAVTDSAGILRMRIQALKAGDVEISYIWPSLVWSFSLDEGDIYSLPEIADPNLNVKRIPLYEAGMPTVNFAGVDVPCRYVRNGRLLTVSIYFSGNFSSNFGPGTNSPISIKGLPYSGYFLPDALLDVRISRDDGVNSGLSGLYARSVNVSEFQIFSESNPSAPFAMGALGQGDATLRASGSIILNPPNGDWEFGN